MEVAAERLDDLLGLVRPHQPVVDEHAGELVADRLVDEQRRDRRVDAAGEAADHPLRADLGRGSARPAPRSPPRASSSAALRRPRRGSSSGSAGRPACGRPRGGTGPRTGLVLSSSNAAIGVDGDAAVTRAPGGGAVTESRWLIHTTCSAGRSWKSGDSPSSASALPYSETSFDSTVPPRSRAISLHAVTDPEGRDPELEHRRVDLRRTLGVHRGRATGEDQRRAGSARGSRPP